MSRLVRRPLCSSSSALEIGGLGHVEMGEHVAHDAGEGALVLDLAVEPVELGAGLGLDLGAPQVDDLPSPRAGGASPVRRSRTMRATAS